MTQSSSVARKEITVRINGEARQVACSYGSQAVMTYDDVVRLAVGDVAIRKLYTVVAVRREDAGNLGAALRPGNHMVVKDSDAFSVVDASDA